MDEEDKVYVIALVGLTPAVVTELLWHLVVRDQRVVVGLELWTTASPTSTAGARSLSEEWGLFGELLEELRRLSEDATQEQPTPLDRIDPIAGALGACPRLICTPSAWDEPPVKLLGFQRPDDSTIEDIRDAHDVELVNAALHDRVRTLREHLPDDVALVGSLAGGRKTMSTALHTAFCLQARRQDQLVHVFLHPTVEARSRTDEARFGFPNQAMHEKTGIQPCDQITVVDVPFPQVRWLVDERFRNRLDAVSYGSIWPIFRSRMGLSDAPRIIFRPIPGRARWRLSIRSSKEAIDVEVPRMQALYYWALIHNPGGLTTASIVCWLEDTVPAIHHRSKWPPQPDSVRARLRELSHLLRSEHIHEDILPQPLDDLYHIPCADQIETPTEG